MGNRSSISFCLNVVIAARLYKIFCRQKKKIVFWLFILKKLAAIFLFALFLFNITGYKIIFFYAQKQSDARLETSLDKNLYDEADLIAITVPLSLPYQNDQKEFDRVNGEISFNGKIYKYVKRRIAEGNLVLLCLPDYNKMRLKKEKEDFYKDVNSFAQNNGSKKQENSKGNSFKNVLSDYDQVHYQSEVALFGVHLSHKFLKHDCSLSAAPHSSPEQPPEKA